jgi:hypothetical protein
VRLAHKVALVVLPLLELLALIICMSLLMAVVVVTWVLLLQLQEVVGLVEGRQVLDRAEVHLLMWEVSQHVDLVAQQILTT